MKALVLGAGIVGVTTAYDKADVLQGVSLSVEPGKITCLLGSNGSGKTTLVRSILSGERTAFEGRTVRSQGYRLLMKTPSPPIPINTRSNCGKPAGVWSIPAARIAAR